MATHVADLSEINPHLGLWQSESYVSPIEHSWYVWVHAVERKLGHGLDGNQATDGFSLDYANDAFESGVSVTEYVAEVQADKAELEHAFGPPLSLPSMSQSRVGARGTAY